MLLGLAANGTPIIGYQRTGNPNQQWAFTLHASGTAYVYAACLTLLYG